MRNVWWSTVSNAEETSNVTRAPRLLWSIAEIRSLWTLTVKLVPSTSLFVVRLKLNTLSPRREWDFTLWCSPSVCFLFVRMFVSRLCHITAALPRNGSHQECPTCFFPVKKSLREIYGCGGGLLVASIKAPHLLTLNDDHSVTRMSLSGADRNCRST